MLLITLAGGVLGAALAWTLIAVVGGSGTAADPIVGSLRPVEIGAAVVGIVAVVWGVLAWHELGHLVAGWAVGFRFALLIVGPLRVYRTADGLRLGLNRTLALYGGLAASVPPAGAEPTDASDAEGQSDAEDPSDAQEEEMPGSARASLTRRTAWMVAGGPLASLAGGVLALAAYVGFGLDVVRPGPWAVTAWFVGQGLLFFGSTSLLILVVTLVPARTSGFRTDGARLLQLWRGGATAPRDEAITMLTGYSLGGVRPRDWPDDAVERAIARRDRTLEEAVGHVFAYVRALDQEAIGAAHAHLQRTLVLAPETPESLQAQAYAEAAYLEGRYRQDASAARWWLEQVRPGAIEDGTYHRAAAAVHAAEGDADRAQEAAATAREALAYSMDPGLARAARDWLTSWPHPSTPSAASPATPAAFGAPDDAASGASAPDDTASGDTASGDSTSTGPTRTNRSGETPAA